MIRSLKLDFKPLLTKLEVFSKKNIRGEFAGEYRSVFKGTGLEFDGYRDYTPADDALKIDWRASIRARKLLVRELIEERNLSVLFLFDVSNSMLFSSHDKLKGEYAAEVIASLGFPMIQAGDSLSLMMFADTIVKHIPLSTGKKQYFTLLKMLNDPAFYGGKYDLTYALKRVSAYLRKDSSLFIVSDFIGLQDDWKDHLKIAAQKYDVLCLIVRDPLDLTLPADVGQLVLQDPFSDKEMLIDPDTMRQSYERTAQRKLKDVTDTITTAGADFVMLETNKSFVEPVIGIFEKRKALWR